MGQLRILNTAPKIGFELYPEGMFANSEFIRLFRDQNAPGFEDDARTTQESIWPNVDGAYAQLREMLQAAGVQGINTNADAAIWLSTTPQDVAMKTLAGIWAQICAFIETLLNRYTTPTSTAKPFETFHDLLQAMMNRTTITEPNADGDVRVIPPTFP